MKAVWLAAFMLWQAVGGNDVPLAHRDGLRYERAVHVEAAFGQACAVLGGQIFPHAAPALADLRIFPVQGSNREAHEIPYVVTLSQPATDVTQAARLLNLGSVDGKVVFDLEMPQRAYTKVDLKIDPGLKDFLATATVTGSDVLHDAQAVALGSFTLFDLTGQRLSRDTTLPLTETSFRYLHMTMSLANAPGGAMGSAARFLPAMVEGAAVPPSREPQVLYTTVAETRSVATVGRESRAEFQLPTRVPVERVSLVLAPGFKGNFSRNVRVTALSDAKEDGADGRAPLQEVATGTVLRIRATEAGREIREEELGFPAILGSNLQGAAKVEVAVDNGDDRPLPITAVRLEMRQREVCFDAAQAVDAGGVALFYGDPALSGPVYDYERTFVASSKAAVAQLGPEMLNAAYQAPAAAARSFAERHPGVIWLALIAVVCALGAIALKSSRSVVR
ncbi:MAG TPA: DUF3999 family protein [Acidobacteriaceae bacterium]|nr:DUF3999 family protein [Acidobacteriaceae bacterium]